MVARCIMVQGTGSDVGKSVITAGLCRLMLRKGLRVAPFKSQNMALNSFITRDGGEIGRAQAVQAEAARVEATVDMNPVLLKPNQDNNSQLIIHGKAIRNMTAKAYFAEQELPFKAIKESLTRLKREWELVILEGAGSPAEINLRDYDLVNMKIAELAKAPVLLVANIDKGGVFASIVGTLELLNPVERDRIKGLIINKFRGDPARFERGKELIEEYTGLPVIGVIPYFEDFCIPEEDSLPSREQGSKNYQIDIAVVYLPHIANFTDFDPLRYEPGVRIRYIKDVTQLGATDLLIIPGSKNTIEDLQYLTQSGFVNEIRARSRQGIPVLGICGGFQMLGKRISDPWQLESKQGFIQGIGLLELETVLEREKITRQVKAEIISDISFLAGLKGQMISGYEIHQGRSILKSPSSPLFKVYPGGKDNQQIFDGLASADGLILGSYLHGLFDNDYLRRTFVNCLRERKGLNSLPEGFLSVWTEREKAYNQLADLLEANLKMELLTDIIFS